MGSRALAALLCVVALPALASPVAGAPPPIVDTQKSPASTAIDVRALERLPTGRSVREILLVLLSSVGGQPVASAELGVGATTLVDGPATDVVISASPHPAGDRPRALGCSPQVISGSTFCVCGDFPKDAAAARLINDRPVGEYLVSELAADGGRNDVLKPDGTQVDEPPPPPASR